MEKLVAPGQDSFWAGRRVFITGHTGFKGGWLSLWLARMGADVCGYSLKPDANPNLFDLLQLSKYVTHVEGDIRDLKKLGSAMEQFDPEIVFHLAAQSLVRLSYESPVVTYSTNVMGTVHVLECIRHTPSVRATVLITTDKCYENHEWHWGYRENDRLGGHDPYSNSKACAELVTAAYRNSYFAAERLEEHKVAIATARAGNVIGGGDWATNRLVPDLLRGFISKQRVSIRNPSAIRPWQHVLEPLRGYLMLAKQLLSHDPAFCSAWNFGPNDSDVRTVQWIAEKLANCWPGATWDAISSDSLHEATFLKLDCSRANDLLRWRPVLGLPGALGLIVDWTREWQAGHDMLEVTLGQIDKYEELCIAAENAK